MATSRLLVLSVLLLAGCTETYTLDFPDVNLDPPATLGQQLKDYRSGLEKWRADPRAVADQALRDGIRDLPWIAEPFKPSLYEVLKSPEWGTYVVRGYVYPSGHLARYRVKIRPFEEIWYPVQLSHYKLHYLSDDDRYHEH